MLCFLESVPWGSGECFQRCERRWHGDAQEMGAGRWAIGWLAAMRNSARCPLGDLTQDEKLSPLPRQGQSSKESLRNSTRSLGVSLTPALRSVCEFRTFPQLTPMVRRRHDGHVPGLLPLFQKVRFFGVVKYRHQMIVLL